MKFSEMPYSRPDMEALAAATTQTLEAMKAAPNAAGQIAAYDAYEKKMQTAGTMQQIAYIRHTINTKDEFYNAENDYMDEIGPKLQELSHQVNTALLESPYRAELERHYGALMFKNLEIAARSFSPAIVELMQEENKLVSEYQNLYASATVEFDGKIMPLPLLGPYKQDPDRAVRKAAYEADAKFFDSHREELDTLYDKLVKVRDAQAKKMGLPNYIPLGYDRMGRNCYTAKDVAAFRDQIAEDMVPIVAKVKEAQRRRIGVEKLAFYDEPISFADGNAVPEGTPDEILAAGKKMYQELSPETAEFIDFMFENELFDVLSRALNDVPVGNHRGGRPARGLSRAGDLRRRLALGLAGTGASALPHGAAEARGSEREGARGLGCLEPPERRPLVHGGRPELSQARRPRQRDVGAARHDALDQAGHAHVRRGQARPRRQGARAQGVAQRADRQDRRARHRAGEADHVHLPGRLRGRGALGRRPDQGALRHARGTHQLHRPGHRQSHRPEHDRHLLCRERALSDELAGSKGGYRPGGTGRGVRAARGARCHGSCDR